MPAYIIAFVEVTDRERYAEYMKVTSPNIALLGGKFIARGGKTETLEGREEKRRVVLIEFPTFEQANAFYHSEQYKQAKKMRAGAATATFILLDGWTPPAEEEVPVVLFQPAGTRNTGNRKRGRTIETPQWSEGRPETENPKHLIWEITEADIAKVKAFVDLHKDNSFVKNRIYKALEGPRPVFVRDRFWHQMIACLLTSQQKSGPESAVSRLIHTEPFPLGYSACLSSGNTRAFVQEYLAGFGGIRRYGRIAIEVTHNLGWLKEGFWGEVEKMWCRLAAADDPGLERDAARLIAEYFMGFGAKQSRNLLQGLGLTKYEIPLDSRVGKRLVEFGFPIGDPKKAFVGVSSYEAILDQVQELCRRCGIYPCVLDAAMFASFDGDGWDGVNVIW